MDQTDIALCMLLLQDSRRPFRDLADKLKLSVAAVHARIQALRDAGIIKAFTARIGLLKVAATQLMVWGVTRGASPEDLLARLKGDDRVYWVAFAGAGSLYTGAYLRTPTELDACVRSVAEAAEMSDPQVGIIPLGPGLPEGPVLDRLDSRILWSLHRDARKSVADVAEELGVSAKTAGRRLSRMVQDGSAEFSMEWYPDAANDIITMWHLDLKASANRDAGFALLMNEYARNMLFVMPLSNLPRFLLAATWTGSMKELKDLQARLQGEAAFERVVPNVLYTGHLLETWRDALLQRWAGAR